MSVTIDNSGDDAYEPQLFGDEILVQRNIEKTSSQYKIKNSSGKIVSTKREVLDNILNHHQIIIDNPMSILTQDAARSFLTSTSTTKIYHYLSEGIQHELWKSKNAEAITSNNEAKMSIRALKDKLKDLLKIKAATEKEYQARLDQENSAKTLRFLKGKLAWKQVEIEENRLTEVQSTLAEYQTQVEKVEAQMESLRASAGNFEESKRSLQEAFSEKQEAVRVVAEKLNAKSNEKVQMKFQLTSAEDDQRSIQREIDNNTKKIAHMGDLLKEEEKNLDGGYVQQRRETKAKLEECNNLRQSVNEKLDSSERKLSDLRRQKQVFDPKIQEAQDTISQYNIEISDYSKDIRNFQDNEKGQLKAFGNTTERVLEEIKRNAHRFHEVPLGPVGRYVTLKNPKWGPILNRQLSSTLMAFIVGDDEDKKLLFSILNACHAPKHSIIVTKKDLFSYESNLPDRKYTTVLDVLDISDEHVKRILINYHKVESTILIENRQEAEGLMYPRPPKVTSCYSLTSGVDGCIVGGGDRNSSGSTPIQGWTLRSLLKSKASDQLDQWKHSLSLAEQSRKQALEEQQKLLSERHKITNEIEAASKAIVTYRERRKKLQNEIFQYEAELSEEVDMTRLNTIKDEIEEFEKSKKKYEEQFTDSLIHKQDMQEQLRIIVKEVEAINIQVNAANREANSVQTELQSLREDQLKYQANLQNFTQKANSARHKVQQCQDSLQKATESVEKAVETAHRFSEDRLQSAEEVEELFQKIRETQEKIRALESGFAKSLSVVTEEYQVACAQYSDSKAQFEQHRQVIKKLCDLQTFHEKRYNSFLTYATASIKIGFHRFLRERNFEGQLVIDHNNQKIQIHAAPKNEMLDDAGVDQKPAHLQKKKKGIKTEDGGDDQKQGRDPRSLSGGEKSFSQIAFLLAVWQAMGTRVRGLDEFDVFMDEVNRKVSMKLMIDAIKGSANVQTIFITPNNMADMKIEDSQVRVHLMADPR